MRRHVVTKPAWRARTPKPYTKPRWNVTVSKALHDALGEKAADENSSMRWLADVLINRALDEAGAP
jgi:hypothetical protein